MLADDCGRVPARAHGSVDVASHLAAVEGVKDLSHEHRHVRRVAVRVGTGDIGVRGGLGRRAESLSLEATSGAGGGWW
jgi:hypothetical protein